MTWLNRNPHQTQPPKHVSNQIPKPTHMKPNPTPHTPSNLSQIDFRDSIISYEISRFEVENGLTERLVHDMRVEAENPLIHAGPGQIVFWVSGYDEDPHEMFQIPHFQKFIRKANKSNPCWIYYADPASYWPQIVTFCTASNAQAVRRQGQAYNTLLISLPDVVSFLDQQLDDFETLCSLANTPDEVTKKMLKEVFRSFGIGHGILAEQPAETP